MIKIDQVPRRAAAWSLIIAPTLLLGLLLCALRPSAFHPALPNDTNSAYYIGYARNLLRYPLRDTKGFNVDRVEESRRLLHESDTIETHYATHPPLLSWATSLFFRGDDPVRASRGISIISSMLLLASLGALIYHLTQSLQILLLLFPFLLSCKVFASHGIVVNFEPLCAELTALSWVLFVRQFEKPTRLNLFLAFGVLTLALMSDWPAYLFTAPLFAFFLANGKRRIATGIALCGISCLGLIIFYYAYVGSQSSYAGAMLHGVARTHTGGDVVTYDRWGSALKKMFVNLKNNFSALNLLLALGLLTLQRAFPVKRNLWAWLVAGSTFAATLNMILFKQWAADHSFWSYYFIIPLTLLCLVVLARLRSTIVFVTIFCAFSFFGFRRVRDLRRMVVSTPGYVNDIKEIARTGSPIFASDNTLYFGNGYVERYYFDRQLRSLNPDEALPSKGWIVLNGAQAAKADTLCGALLPLYSWNLAPVSARTCLRDKGIL